MPLPYEAVCTGNASHWRGQWSVPASLFPSTRLALIWLRTFYKIFRTENASRLRGQWSVPASLFPSTRLALIWLRIFYKIFRTENASHWLRQWGLPSAGARFPFSEYLVKFYAGCAMRVVAKINGSCVRQM